MRKISGVTLWRLGQFALLLIVFPSALSISRLQAANDSPPPQLIYMTRTGLDLTHNRIDQLIDMFGFVCLKNPINPRACRIEKELVSFLKTLRPNDISSELTALGAACQNKGKLLTCLYERRVEVGTWLAGSSEPETVFDELFRIEFGVDKNIDPVGYHVVFGRTETVKGRRGYSKSN